MCVHTHPNLSTSPTCFTHTLQEPTYFSLSLHPPARPLHPHTLQWSAAGGGGLGGGCPCHMSIIRNGNIALFLTSLHPVDFKKTSCHHVNAKKVPCHMSLRPKKGWVAILISRVHTPTAPTYFTHSLHQQHPNTLPTHFIHTHPHTLPTHFTNSTHILYSSTSPTAPKYFTHTLHPHSPTHFTHTLHQQHPHTLLVHFTHTHQHILPTHFMHTHPLYPPTYPLTSPTHLLCTHILHPPTLFHCTHTLHQQQSRGVQTSK